ncbi:hypothetical protein F5884DRAFT_750735 [Xylogone sp. PMI_703]|nr:hypothetical protein F5884DRAFT_750735 [Xylogone sp. PMI_703]
MFSHDGVEIWDRATGDKVGSLNVPKTRAGWIRLGWCGPRLVVCLSDNFIQIWDLEGRDQKSLLPLELLPLDVSGRKGFWFSTDWKLFALVADSNVEIWDTSTQTRLHLLPGLPDSPDSPYYTSSKLAFSSDTTLLAYAQEYGISIWNIKTGQKMHQIELWGVRNISFDTSMTHLYTLRTNIGALMFGSSLAHATSEPLRKGYGYGPNTAWITWDGANVLWLPPGYRSSVVAAAQSSIAIKSDDSRIVIFRFLPEDIAPVM